MAKKLSVCPTTIRAYRTEDRKPKERECKSDTCNNMFMPDDFNHRYCCLECRNSEYKRKFPYIPKEKVKKVDKMEKYNIKLKEVFAKLNLKGTK